MNVKYAPHVESADAAFVHGDGCSAKKRAGSTDRFIKDAGPAKDRRRDRNNINNARLHANGRMREIIAGDTGRFFGAGHLPALAKWDIPKDG